MLLRSSLFFGLVLAVITCAATAILLEGLVRGVIDDGRQFDLEMWKYARDLKTLAADSSVGHEHRPGAHARLMGVDVEINHHKLRDRNIGFERRNDVFRILMLGDSLIFGWGVPAEATISKRLEALLNNYGIRAEVINAGVGNYNTSMEVAYLIAEGNLYNPDLILLGYFINDAERAPHYNASWLARNSAAYAYISARLDVLFRMFGIGTYSHWKSHLARIYDPGDPSSGWLETVAAFDRLSKIARGRSVPVVVVNLPELRQLQPYPFAVQEAKVRSLAQTKGFAYFDLQEAVSALEASSLWVAPDDSHPNARADDLFAKAIFEFLKTENLVSHVAQRASSSSPAGNAQ